MKKHFLYTVFILFTGIHGFTQDNDSIIIRKLSVEIMTGTHAYENLRYLCKKIGPRLSGSENTQKAVEATARMLREAGADTVYLQPCFVPHWVRGEKETGYIVLQSGEKYSLNLCALGNSVATGKDGVRSEVIEINSYDELERLGEKGIAGKLVFYNSPMNPSYIETFKAYGESGVFRRNGPSRAAKYGAAGVIIRSLASNIDEFPHTGSTTYNDSFPKIPAIAISTKDAEWLSLQLRKQQPVFVFFKTNCQMLPDVPSFNVIGEIKGTQFPQEIITVGGHLDSWDLGEGAQDDGAGCVQSIEIIRALKATGLKPKRTIRAVMFMNEENGGRGAKAYLAAAKLLNEQHIFALESDAGGFTPRGFSLDMKELQRNKITEWKYLFDDYSVYDFRLGGSGSDIGPLKEIGTALCGLRPDSQRYFDLHHAATDIFEAVSIRELNLGTVNMAALVWLVSEYGL